MPIHEEERMFDNLEKEQQFDEIIKEALILYVEKEWQKERSKDYSKIRFSMKHRIKMRLWFLKLKVIGLWNDLIRKLTHFNNDLL